MTRPEPHPDHVTPYDRFAWSDSIVEQLLATGEQRRELIAYFGEAEYEALVPLARQAASVKVTDDAPRVFIVPGIMGSQLGLLRPAPLPNDVLWIDPVDIGIGNLSLLRLPDGAHIVSLGVVLFTYLRLKLQLRIAGFAPVCHHYDWRLGIDELGGAFAETLAAVAVLVQRVRLQHRAHRAVEYQNAPRERLFQFGDAVGIEIRQGVHCIFLRSDPSLERPLVGIHASSSVDARDAIQGIASARQLRSRQ